MRSTRALEVYEKINCQFVYIDYIAKISSICKYIYITSHVQSIFSIVNIMYLF